ncbi:unnamed protein product [Rotaria sordida]|uniref:B box-type domain-containing protein n=1 Tax=Rotaria sordida TaxID=392033 RepID=A0A815RN72_9BILA|nr:unnamed protein product [Rotaria sordida]CAF1542429.1 unnamed protein product [Rotaria sordida]CAF4149762.1 unnamed protein product [Rotaria sordida]CAF4220849.1 unnamed protein product [Rotaria sordida]
MAAASTTPSSIDFCVICQTLTGEKPKPGILPCLGCQQLFCYQHIGQHRQQLADQLDIFVVNERNNLFEITAKLEKNCDQYTINQMKEIDDWEFETHEIIKQLAENARQKLHKMALDECDNLRARFNLLSAELNDKRESDSYFESDIEALKYKFHQLKYDMENVAFKIDVNNDLQTMELINIKKKPSGSDSFIDQILLTQKPIKSINIPNDGLMYAVNTNLLAFHHGGAREIDLYNTNDGSLKTMTRTGNYGNDLCYSAYLQSFLYLIQQRGPKRCDLYRWNITYNSEPEKINLENTQNISSITCYEANLIVVHGNTIIEKWKLNDLKLDARWRTPVSCEQNESIKTVQMTSQYYSLVINKYDGCHFELRNSTMSRIGSVKVINDYIINPISLPNESGWLFYYRSGCTSYSYVIDNQLNIHQQKYILAVKVNDIVAQGKTVIIRYDGEANDASKRKRGCIEYYEWK